MRYPKVIKLKVNDIARGSTFHGQSCGKIRLCPCRVPGLLRLQLMSSANATVRYVCESKLGDVIQFWKLWILKQPLFVPHVTTANRNHIYCLSLVKLAYEPDPTMVQPGAMWIQFQVKAIKVGSSA